MSRKNTSFYRIYNQWIIGVQQDQNILGSMCLYFHLGSLIQTFHGTDIYLLSKMCFRGMKPLWMSVLCKARDLGKLRQIYNSGHSWVNMFLKTWLKTYVHILYIKRQYIGFLFFFQEKLFNHGAEYASYHFPLWKATKVKKFLNPSSVHHFFSILRAHERWVFPSSILSSRQEIRWNLCHRYP